MRDLSKPRSIFLISILLLSYLAIISSYAPLSTAHINLPVTIVEDSFSSSERTHQRFDLTTEVYDAGTTGNSQVGVDEANGWLVFTGFNEENADNPKKDEPIAVLKAYQEPDGFPHYLRLPCNYTVYVDFSLPLGSKGHFYVLPRYGSVANKYEVVVDTDFNNLVFNVVLSGEWRELKISPLGFDIEEGKWYRLQVTVIWITDPSTGDKTNRIIATVTDLADPVNTRSDEIIDASIPPSAHNGLAILGFHPTKDFTVLADNLRLDAQMEKVGEEPDEALTPSDLDVKEAWVLHDDRLFIMVRTAGSIVRDPSETKYWSVELDADKDSLASLSWFRDYLIVFSLGPDGTEQAHLYDGLGNWISQVQIVGGGESSNALIVGIPLGQLPLLSESLLLYSYTELGASVIDRFPESSAMTGDFLTYPIEEPPVDWKAEVADSSGDASPSYLDITDFKAGLTSELLIFKIEVSGILPWYGGSPVGTYWIFMDTDGDATTGYSVGGIGADYMVEYHLGYAPKLYENTGAGWSWSLVGRCELVHNPGGGTEILLSMPRRMIPDLHRELTLVAGSGQSSSLLDYANALTMILVYNAEYSDAGIPVDTSGKEIDVVGEATGSPGSYDFAGWYTNTVAFDPGTKTAAVAWVRKDADSYGNDIIYLEIVKMDSKNASLIVKYVGKASSVDSIDSLIMGEGRILITWTYYTSSTKTNVRAALYDLDGNYIWSGDVRDTTYFEEYSRSCYVPGEGKFLVIWYSSDGRKVEGRWLSPDGSMGSPFYITSTGGLSYTQADLMLCVGGGSKALVVYRYLDGGGDIGLSARLVDSSGVSGYITLYDDNTKEEMPGISGAYLEYGGNGYFLVPFLSGSEVRYAVVRDDGTVVSNDKRLTVNGREPYAISLEDRFVISYVYLNADPEGDPRIANINPETWAYHIKVIDSDSTQMARHPLMAYDSLNDRIVYLWTSGSPSDHEVAYAIIDPQDSPGEYPTVEEKGTLLSMGGNQMIDGLAVVSKDEYLAVYRDNSYGVQELMSYVRLPEKEDLLDAFLIELPEQGYYYKSILEGLIDEASSKIYVAVAFIDYEDILKKLVEAHNRGVDVKVIMDDSPGNSDALDYLRTYGVEAIDDSSLGDPTHIMHDKFIVIDGRKLLVSTVNLIEDDFFRNNNTAFVVSSRIAAYYYEKEFLQMWNGGSGKFGIEKTESNDFISSATYSGRQLMFQGLFTPQEFGDRGRIPNVLAGYVKRASKLRFASYIFTTSGWVSPLYDSIIHVFEGGGSVVGVFDELLNLHNRGRRIYDLIDEGVSVYVDTHKNKMHAKLFVMDDALAALGSWNPTKSATTVHDENILLIMDDSPGGFASRLSDWVDEMASDPEHFSLITPTSTYKAPHLLITEVMFMPDSTGDPDGEWVEIYNPTDDDVDLTDYLIGDSETLLGTAPYDDESLYRFPAGAIIQAGRRIVVAYKASEFESTYGYKPDFELVDTDPTVPDLYLYEPADYGDSWNLDDSGDEVLLIKLEEGGFLQIVSAAWYGSSTYLDGPVDTTALASGQVIQRVPEDHDAAYASAVFTVAALSLPYAELSIGVETPSGDHLTCQVRVTSSWGVDAYVGDGDALQITSGDQVTLVAQDCFGYSFLRWEGYVSDTTPHISFEMPDHDIKETAVYSSKNYELNIRVVDDKGSSLSCTVEISVNGVPVGSYGDGDSLTIQEGAEVKLFPSECSGYSLDHWELDGTELDEVSPTFTMIEDMTLKAIFTRSSKRRTIAPKAWYASIFPEKFRYVAKGVDLEMNTDILSKTAGPSLPGQRSMLIILGGPDVVPYNWRAVGVSFLKDRGSFVGLEFRSKVYIAAFGEVDYAVIYVDRENMVIRVAGITRYGTRAGLMYLMEHPDLLSASGIYLIRWEDLDGNGDVSLSEISPIFP